MRPALCLLLAAVALALAGCGGGGSGGDAATGETTETTEVETTETVLRTETEEGAPEAPNTVICQEVANSSSQLNIAASNGDFATVVARWKVLLPEFPADVQPQVKTLIEGYEKVAADPNQFVLLDQSPYKDALEAVNAHTAQTCGN